MQKVDNIGIFVQFVNWEKLETESISMQIDICHGALNPHWSDWFLYLPYFQI